MKKLMIGVTLVAALFSVAQQLQAGNEIMRSGRSLTMSDIKNILSTAKISRIKFDDHSLDEVFNILAETASLNIILSDDVRAMEQTIDLTLNNERSVMQMFR